MNVFWVFAYRCGLAVMAILGALTTFAWAVPFPTGYINTDSVANTRHNLSLRVPVGTPYGPSGASLNVSLHNNVRNQYDEVCVYCHTPHGANSTVAAPLWNRTIKATTYTLYNSISLTQTVSQPGSNSLVCLSCHDGQTAIDSIINMPGSGRSLASQATVSGAAFLDTWNNLPTGALDTTVHYGLNSLTSASPIVLVPPIGPPVNFPGLTLPAGSHVGNGQGTDGIGCLTCHSPVGLNVTEGNDMRVMNLGTDLSNDHPVGVTFPAANGPGTDFNTPSGTKGTSLYFEANGNGNMDKAEIRTYDGKVECASCHDPHGVPSAGSGSMFNPTFLRVSNAGSALCLTCHVK